jgi:hypothetical protein
MNKKIMEKLRLCSCAQVHGEQAGKNGNVIVDVEGGQLNVLIILAKIKIFHLSVGNGQSQCLPSHVNHKHSCLPIGAVPLRQHGVNDVGFTQAHEGELRREERKAKLGVRVVHPEPVRLNGAIHRPAQPLGVQRRHQRPGGDGETRARPAPARDLPVGAGDVDEPHRAAAVRDTHAPRHERVRPAELRVVRVVPSGGATGSSTYRSTGSSSSASQKRMPL